ncbi:MULTISPECIES: hypothetical protein [Aerococcus]|uniref:Helix-turn-helix domain-containing protein n=1 Tax=Aerococcus sanguinicola TaxID=119206 RepID=A0A5N1GIH3_9LACT|nr:MULTISPECIES: hypothetical protein [Aerococcus]KAA9300767.1 hypothetical protein F6I03_05530 [Aerococcus sanguinicola]MDK6369448.1 hypothetical protein [Aerococcus sp. UMB9870]MDK6680511.1 hypothetical protein [Aerococcus sp. UMB8608]MDK6686689.1 hypothetical protein [Aerococcus sp. UMB8623]MDK6940458.1 hypothetical protein [Aerococcus sp. UMB8487]
MIKHICPSPQTSYVRIEKDNNYSLIDNEFLQRPDLSWKAKGILAYLLSLPDDWVIRIETVKDQATDGKTSFRSGWTELVKEGYIERLPVRHATGNRIKFWKTIVYERPLKRLHS